MIPALDILSDLNPEQRQAVTHGHGPLLIVAGAGTGKTTVLTRRVAWLIQEGLAKPDQVLALTFSEKAAREMEERVDVLLPLGLAPTGIMTFHAFGHGLLEEQALRLGLAPGAELISGPELNLFLRQRLFELPLKKLRPLANPGKHVDALAKVFGKAKDEAVREEVWLAEAEKMLTQAQSDAERAEAEEQFELAQCFAAYNRLLRRDGFLDHGDQLSLALQALDQHPQALAELRARYPWILVDEFQDTNTVQFELIKRLSPAGPQAGLTVVGDDDQAIYRFRGASLENILQFRAHYQGAKAVVLKRNYRSRQEILDKALILIRHNDPDRLESREGLDKALLAARQDKVEGPALAHQGYALASEERAAIAQDILDSHASGRAWRDHAVLVRSNSTAQDISAELAYREIPYRFTGAKGLYQRPEIRVCIDLLRALARPENDVALFGHLTGDVCRVPVNELKLLLAKARSLNQSLYRVLTKTQLNQNGEEFELDPEAWPRVEKALLDLAKLEELSRKQGLAPALYTFLRESGLLSRWLADQNVENERCLANVARFFERIKGFDRIESRGSYLAVVEYLDDLIEEGDNPAEAEQELDADAVTVSTVHRAKGLEWPWVYLAGLEQGHFPQTRKSDGFSLPASLFPPPASVQDAHVAEERRLFYVALTRARDRLMLSHARDQGGKKMWKRSLFLDQALNLGPEGPPLAPLKMAERIQRQASRPQHPLLGPLKAVAEGEQLRLSYYPVDDYMFCPLKYKISSLIKLKPPVNSAISYGSSVHQAIQAFNRARMEGKPLSEAEFLNAFALAWRSEGYEAPEHEQARLETGKEKLKAFRDSELALGNTPIHVERRFELRLRDLDVLTGQMDCVEKAKDGSVTVLDYKTSNVHDVKKAKEEVKKSLQLAIYCMAYQSWEGRLPERLELYFIESGIREGFKPDEAYVKEKKEEILVVFDAVRQGKFAATPEKYKCGICAYNRICPSAYGLEDAE